MEDRQRRDVVIQKLYNATSRLLEAHVFMGKLSDQWAAELAEDVREHAAAVEAIRLQVEKGS